MSVENEQYVLHVRTANPDRTRQVEQWLSSAGMAERSCPDAYAAVLQLRHQPPALLVLVGLDGLPAEHDRLLSIMQQAWRGTPRIGYGTSATRKAQGLTRVFLGNEIEKLLSVSPAVLARELIGGRGLNGQRSDALDCAAWTAGNR